MNSYKELLDDIERKRQRLKEGKINCIPFELPGMRKVIPGIMPESQVALTTISGGGKTVLTNKLYVKSPFDYWMKNKDKQDFDIKIFLFCLEDSVKMTMKRFMIEALWSQLNIRIGMYEIDCYFNDDDKKITDETKRAMDSLEPYFDMFYSKVELLEIRNPTGIATHVKDWLKKPENGHIVDKHGNKLSKKQILDINKAKADKLPGAFEEKLSYKPTNDNRFVMVNIDNMQNVKPEKGMDGPKAKWMACDRLCREYLRDDLCGFYKTSNFIVAQQDKSKEKAQYKDDGEIVIDKFIPSLDCIAEYKNITDTCHIVMGLFSPYRYQIEDFLPMGYKVPYDIRRLQDFYRNLYVLKGNFVGANINTSLMFDGITGTISELPAPGTPELTEIYKYCQRMIMNEKGIKPLKIN